MDVWSDAGDIARGVLVSKSKQFRQEKEEEERDLMGDMMHPESELNDMQLRARRR